MHTGWPVKSALCQLKAFMVEKISEAASSKLAERERDRERDLKQRAASTENLCC